MAPLVETKWSQWSASRACASAAASDSKFKVYMSKIGSKMVAFLRPRAARRDVSVIDGALAQMKPAEEEQGLTVSVSDEVLFAGEAWKTEDGTIHINNNSGSYKPDAARLEVLRAVLSLLLPSYILQTHPMG